MRASSIILRLVALMALAAVATGFGLTTETVAAAQGAPDPARTACLRLFTIF